VKVIERLQQSLTDPNHIEFIEKTATKAAYAASAGNVFLGFTADEWGVIGIVSGIVLGVLTFGFNVWFRMKYQRPNNDE